MALGSLAGTMSVSMIRGSVGLLGNKGLVSLVILHISLVCLTGGLDGSGSLGKRRHHRKPEQRLRRGEQLPPDASVFLSDNNTVVSAHKGSTTSLLCQVHKDSQHGVEENWQESEISIKRRFSATEHKISFNQGK